MKIMKCGIGFEGILIFQLLRTQNLNGDIFIEITILKIVDCPDSLIVCDRTDHNVILSGWFAGTVGNHITQPFPIRGGK